MFSNRPIAHLHSELRFVDPSHALRFSREVALKLMFPRAAIVLPHAELRSVDPSHALRLSREVALRPMFPRVPIVLVYVESLDLMTPLTLYTSLGGGSEAHVPTRADCLSSC